MIFFFFFSSRRRHTRSLRDWSSDVCSSDLLCVGNGMVMEIINDVMRVYNPDGTPAKGVEDLNTFFGYAPAIIRGTPNVFGPFATDPSCYYDKDTNRWFADMLTIDVFAKNDPAHHCTGIAPYGQATTPTNPNACLGDYPHLGADANGIYLTTNEYSFFGNDFHGAQVYALSKRALQNLA